MEVIELNGRKIGPGNPCFMIGEIAQSHDGSLGIAHSYIDALAETGVDAVKFQTHFADAESTLDDKFRIRFSYEDQTRYDYWKRMEFSEEQWKELAAHAIEKKLIFLSSPFSVQAAKLLQKIQIPAWKLPSGELENYELLQYIAKTKKPVLLSSGMSSWKELEAVFYFFNNYQSPVSIFQCTSSYPVNLSSVGLNIIQEIKKKFNVPSGLSDHSGSIFPSLSAMAQGADLIEVHVVFHKKMFGPDTVASITVEELELLVNARDAFWEMQRHVNKDEIAEEMKDMKMLFGRSLALKVDLSKGEIISKSDLTLKKPGTGISYKHIDKVVGKKAKRSIPKKRLLRWEDLEAEIE